MVIVYLKDGTEYLIRQAKVKRDTTGEMEPVKVASESNNLTFGEGELSITLDEEMEFIKSTLDSESRCFLIAEVDGKIIGNLNFVGSNRPRIKHVGEFGVSILKEFWGNGLANDLIDQLINWAKDGGNITKINLRVKEDNTSAIKLYKKIGFSIEGFQSRGFCIDGKYFSSYSMGLEL